MAEDKRSGEDPTRTPPPRREEHLSPQSLYWPYPPRGPARIPELLDVLNRLWSSPARHQERFGQFVVNVIRCGTQDLTPEDIERRLWAIEDDKFLALLRQQLDELPPG